MVTYDVALNSDFLAWSLNYLNTESSALRVCYPSLLFLSSSSQKLRFKLIHLKNARCTSYFFLGLPQCKHPAKEIPLTVTRVTLHTHKLQDADKTWRSDNCLFSRNHLLRSQEAKHMHTDRVKARERERGWERDRQREREEGIAQAQVLGIKLHSHPYCMGVLGGLLMMSVYNEGD